MGPLGSPNALDYGPFRTLASGPVAPPPLAPPTKFCLAKDDSAVTMEEGDWAHRLMGSWFGPKVVDSFSSTSRVSGIGEAAIACGSPTRRFAFVWNPAMAAILASAHH